MSQICSFEDCERDVFQDRQECVLHCEKKDYSTDWFNIKILANFYDELIEYIANFIFHPLWGSSQDLNIDSIDSLKRYLKDEFSIDDVISDLPLTVAFNGIFFPCRDDRDRFDYFKILKKLESIHFGFCKFSLSWIDLPEVKFFYQDCEFNTYWYISKSKLLGNMNNVLYQNCIFNGAVSTHFEADEERVLEISLFNDCTFRKSLVLSSLAITKPLFKNTENIVVEIPELQIRRCNIENEFLLSDLKTNLLHIEKSKFLSKVEIQKCDIAEAKFIDSDFKSSFDAYGTSFGNFFAATTIFSDFAGFERCEFGKASDENGVAQFEYVTFLSFANIRNTIFHQGLNLEDTNLKEAPNFLNIQLLSDNTNRETYRIIKHSFDKIGNHIEANRFYAKEMDKYQQSLKDKPISQEKIIFWLNKYSSNFGQSYLLPIFWIAVFTGIYYLIIQGYESEILYSSYLPWNEKINFFATKLNDVASNVIPFKNLMKESKGYEFITLIFYVVLASLIWQTIVALKRYTQR
ncbi:MAG: hypothetical protein VX875_07555 [Pseudomonadota bacterium]|nr:hypothetical protein [Pseudomonadota bacterium]